MQTIKEARESRSITVTAAQSALGVSYPTYVKYEESPQTMPVGKFVALCEFLDVSPSDIFLPETVSKTRRKED